MESIAKMQHSLRQIISKFRERPVEGDSKHLNFLEEFFSELDRVNSDDILTLFKEGINHKDKDELLMVTEIFLEKKYIKHYFKEILA